MVVDKLFTDKISVLLTYELHNTKMDAQIQGHDRIWINIDYDSMIQ